MHEFIEEKIKSQSDELRAICERARVRRLDIFGSAVSGGFEPEHSDIDLLVAFDANYFPGMADAYLELADSLERLFGRDVDLLTERSVRNPYLRDSIERSRTPIYEAGNAKTFV